ncbi:DUF4926 domain-containing protein [Lyngbya aestuarii]|uniref:DUF4926 domain-containing protein n=1 Tax=Lyngbya aestuarii TaxID=118322 RepID=UPI00403E1C7B
MIFSSGTSEVDLPQYNLWRGQFAAVVEILAEGTAFEVEFSDACGGLRLRNGRTSESLGLRPDQIIVIWFEPASPDTNAEIVTA